MYCGHADMESFDVLAFVCALSICMERRVKMKINLSIFPNRSPIVPLSRSVRPPTPRFSLHSFYFCSDWWVQAVVTNDGTFLFSYPITGRIAVLLRLLWRCVSHHQWIRWLRQCLRSLQFIWGSIGLHRQQYDGTNIFDRQIDWHHHLRFGSSESKVRYSMSRRQVSSWCALLYCIWFVVWWNVIFARSLVLLNRCLPGSSEKQANKFFSKTGIREFFQEVNEDITTCSNEIIYMFIIAFGEMVERKWRVKCIK